MEVRGTWDTVSTLSSPELLMMRSFYLRLAPRPKEEVHPHLRPGKEKDEEEKEEERDEGCHLPIHTDSPPLKSQSSHIYPSHNFNFNF